MKKLKVTGDYATYDKKHIDFDVEIIIPDCPEEYYITNASRVLPIVLKESPDYPQSMQNLAHIYIDDVEDVPDDYSIHGVNIKEMSVKQMQELACYSLIRSIPLANQHSIREARELTYKAYSKEKLENDVSDVPFGELPPLIINIDGLTPIQKQVKPKEESKSKDQTLTLEDLKAIADEKGILFAPGIGYETLYKRVFPT